MVFVPPIVLIRSWPALGATERVRCFNGGPALTCVMARLSRNLDRFERLFVYALSDDGDWADTELRLDVDSGLYVAALRFVTLGHAVCKFAVVSDCDSVWLGANQAIRFVAEPVEASAPSSPLSESASALSASSDCADWSTTAVDGLVSIDRSHSRDLAWTGQPRSADVSQCTRLQRTHVRHAVGSARSRQQAVAGGGPGRPRPVYSRRASTSFSYR